MINFHEARSCSTIKAIPIKAQEMPVTETLVNRRLIIKCQNNYKKRQMHPVFYNMETENLSTILFSHGSAYKINTFCNRAK